MKTLPLSLAKRKFSKLIERVHTHDEEVVITKNGRAVAVLVSPGEFESWKETVAIRNDPALMREIRSGLAALKTQKAKLYTLEELIHRGCEIGRHRAPRVRHRRLPRSRGGAGRTAQLI